MITKKEKEKIKIVFGNKRPKKVTLRELQDLTKLYHVHQFDEFMEIKYLLDKANLIKKSAPAKKDNCKTFKMGVVGGQVVRLS